MKITALTTDLPWKSSKNSPKADFWTILSFDSSDSLRAVTQANLYPYNFNQRSISRNTDDILHFYSSKIPLANVNLGIPLFGRRYCSTTFPLGSSYDVCREGERVPFN
jgi:hypothetical protein